MDLPKPEFEALLRKVESLRAGRGADLSTEEDLAIAVMNLVSLEEHFYFTGAKTGDAHYFDLLGETREIRKALLARLVDRHEGETWCISKHLLATTMRLMEVGTKLHADGKVDDGKAMFDRAHQAWSLFWALRLKLIDGAAFRKAAAAEKPWTLQQIVDRLVDCCDE